jgi:hypothetical protein
MSNYCFDLIKKENTNELKNSKFKKIYDYLLKNVVKIINFKINKNHVEKTFKILDKIYFNNTITNFMNNTKSKLKFSISSRLKKTAGYCKWKKIIDNNGNFNYGDFEIQISKPIIDNLFSNKKTKSLKINGIHCFNKLECYINLFQHEITHLLIAIICEDYGKGMGGHTKMFKSIAYNLFGHTEYKHLLLEGDSIKMEEEILFNKTNVEIGDYIITKEIKKKIFEGEVYKIAIKYLYIKQKDGKIIGIPFHQIKNIKKNNNKKIIKTQNIEPNEIKKKLKINMWVFVKINNELKKGKIVKINSKRATVIFDGCTKYYVPYNLINIE